MSECEVRLRANGWNIDCVVRGRVVPGCAALTYGPLDACMPPEDAHVEDLKVTVGGGEDITLLLSEEQLSELARKLVKSICG